MDVARPPRDLMRVNDRPPDGVPARDVGTSAVGRVRKSLRLQRMTPPFAVSMLATVLTMTSACSESALESTAALGTERDVAEDADMLVAPTAPDTNADSVLAAETSDFDASAPPSTGRIPPSTNPCRNSTYWPYSLFSEATDLRVHFREANEAQTARAVLAAATWTLPYQQDVLAFRRPEPDGGRCGPDGAIDLFLWRGAPSTFTDLIAPNHTTWWDDGYPYVVLDLSGSLGGRYLPSTVTHELNHVLQAADAWNDAPVAYEMTAMFVESLVHPDDPNWLDYLEDFQRRPDWSLDHDDGYATLYMYGSAVYLQYLMARHFPNDPGFIGAIWFGMRNQADTNEPDFIDAIEAVLAQHFQGFADTVLEFARWRWYTGWRDDGRHLPNAGAHPNNTVIRGVPVTLDPAGRVEQTMAVQPMLLGTTYIDLNGPSDAPVEVQLSSTAPVHWVVQVLPGDGDGDDGNVLLQGYGTAVTRLVGTKRTLAVTALPADEADLDPDERSASRFSATLRMGLQPSPAR